jgi:HlyD family secretion protein
MVALPLNLRKKPAKRSVFLIFSILLLLLLIPISARLFRKSNISPSLVSSSAAAADNLSIIEVRRGSLKKTLLLDGELRAVRSRTVWGSTSEDVKIVYLPPEGTVVKAGDRLVDLDNTSVVTRIKDIEERIVAAENEIVRSKAQHESALRDLDVERSKLWLTFEQAKLDAKVPPEIQARRESQEAQLTLEKARTEYENHLKKIESKKKEQSAELQVKIIDKNKLDVQLNRAKNNLEGLIIKAPGDGMVIYNDHWNERRKMQVGDFVWGGWAIVRLPDLSEMEVLAQVNEVDGPKLSIGGKAEIKLDSYPDTVINGQIKEISQTAIKASWMAKAKIFRVTVSLDRTVTEIMKPGMSAQVAVGVSESNTQLLIPRSAIKFEGETAKVVRVADEKGATQETVVKILAADALNYLIADDSGLKEGDKILANPNNQTKSD